MLSPDGTRRHLFSPNDGTGVARDHELGRGCAMRSAPFPRDYRRDAKAQGRRLVRVQVDGLHLGGEAVETVGAAPEWVALELLDVLRRWREASESGVEVVQ